MSDLVVRKLKRHVGPTLSGRNGASVYDRVEEYRLLNVRERYRRPREPDPERRPPMARRPFGPW